VKHAVVVFVLCFYCICLCISSEIYLSLSTLLVMLVTYLHMFYILSVTNFCCLGRGWWWSCHWYFSFAWKATNLHSSCCSSKWHSTGIIVQNVFGLLLVGWL